MLDSDTLDMPVPLKKGQQELLEAIIGYTSRPSSGTSGQEPCWLTTREIADLCDFSIYKARYLLLDLVDKGYVAMSGGGISNSLKWRPVPSI